MAFYDDFFATIPIDQQSPLISFFLPFLLIFALFFGALAVVKVFNKKINVVISLVLTLLTTQTPVFTWFASYLPTYGAVAAVGLFGALFVFGLFRWAFYRGRNIYEEQGG